MSGDRPAPAIDCDHCGYALTGLVVTPGQPLCCPECGHRQHRALARPPWPRWTRVALTLCGPHAALAGAATLLIVLRAPLVLGVVFPTLILGWLLVAFVAPAHFAIELSRRHALQPAQAMVATGLTLSAWAANLTVCGVFVLLARAFARL